MKGKWQATVELQTVREKKKLENEFYHKYKI